MNVLEQNNVGLEFLVLLTVTDGSEECMPSKRGGGGGGVVRTETALAFFLLFFAPSELYIASLLWRRPTVEILPHDEHELNDGRKGSAESGGFIFIFLCILFILWELKSWGGERNKGLGLGRNQACLYALTSVQCTVYYSVQTVYEQSWETE